MILLDQINTNSPSGQVVCIATEAAQAVAVLDEADKAGLIRQGDRAELGALRGKLAVGLLSDADATEAMARLLAQGPAAEKALDAIAPAFLPGDVIELRTVNPAGGGGPSYCGRLDVPVERAGLEAFFHTHVGRLNIYVGVNPRDASFAGTTRAANAGDIVARRAMLLDFDYFVAPAIDPDWSQTVASLRTLDPVLVLNSGNGVHVWLDVADVDGTALDATTGPLKAAMARLGSDDMSNLPGIARLPFSVNLPTAAKRGRGNVMRLAVPMPGRGPALPAVLQSPPPTVAALCATLGDIAVRLALPGKGAVASSASPSPSRLGANGEEKTPWPAPSAALLRMAVEAIPNGAGQVDREKWAALGHAIKGAAVAGNCEVDGREIWLEFSDKSPISDPADAEVRWDGFRNPHVGWGHIMKELEQVNPAGREAVRAAVAAHDLANQAATNIAALSAHSIQAVQPFVPSQLPPRQWLYGRNSIRGFFSVLVAPGGAGKSALVMVEALAMTTGRELLQGDKPIRQLNVWYHNAEDSADEMQRRLAAAMSHHGIQHSEIAGRLFLTSGRDFPLGFARMGKDGPELVPGTGDWILKTARHMGADVVIFDPIGAMHTLPENSNEAMNLLAGGLRQLAHEANLGIVVLHHAGKAAASDMGNAGAGASRGASSFTDAARFVRQIAKPKPEDASKLGIAANQSWRYLRVDNGKANLTRIEDARWLRLVSVRLWNSTPEYPDGDEVQTVESWTPPTVQPGTASDLALVQDAILARPTSPRMDVRAKDWVGWLVADALNLDAGCGAAQKDRTAIQSASYARVTALMKDWVASGALVLETQPDPKGRAGDVQTYVRSGLPAMIADAAEAAAPARGEVE